MIALAGCYFVVGRSRAYVEDLARRVKIKFGQYPAKVRLRPIGSVCIERRGEGVLLARISHPQRLVRCQTRSKGRKTPKARRYE
jgi:hypothetical protein